ncbi:MAG: ABC transporter permease [Acholeplasmatales bacterium]|nr:ABC transporter permease [Acholeplasmatales bacterium]
MENANTLSMPWYIKVLRALKKFFTNRTFLYIVKRILTSFVTLLILVAIVSLLIRLLPDEYFYKLNKYDELLGKSGEIVAENYRKKTLFLYGILDENGNRIPAIQSIFQYIYYILPFPKSIPYVWDRKYEKVTKTWTGLIYLGRSISKNQFVADIIKERMGISFTISIISVFFTYLVGFPLGIAMAKKPGGVVDKIGTAFIVLNYAIPAIVFYLFINTWTGNKQGMWGWASFDYTYVEGDPRTLIMPIFCIFFLSLPGLIIWVRRFMVDELNSDYVKFARSKGLSENRIMYFHVFRNASVPLIRNIPATLLGAIIGSYFVESIWVIPGTGKELVQALQGTPDVPAIQGLTVLYATISMLAFLLGDLITVFFDPRIRLTSK